MIYLYSQASPNNARLQNNNSGSSDINLSNIVFSQGSKLAVVQLSQTTKIISGATNLCRVVAPRTTQSAKALAPWGIHIADFCFRRIIIPRVYSRAQPCGISAIWKKMLQKNRLCHSCFLGVYFLCAVLIQPLSHISMSQKKKKQSRCHWSE